MYTPHPNFPSDMPPKFERAVKWMLLLCVVAIVLSYCSSCTTAKPKKTCGEFVPNAELLKDSSFHGDYYRRLMRIKYSVDSMINAYK